MFALRLFAMLGSAFILGVVFLFLEKVLVPFIGAWVLAYLLVPLVDRLDRYVPRWLAILVSFVSLAAVLGGVLLGLVPVLHAQITNFLSQLPDYAARIDRLLGSVAGHFHLRVDVAALSSNIQGRLLRLGTNLLRAPAQLMSTAARLIETMVFIALVPVVAFFLLRDWHGLVIGLETFVRSSRRSSLEQFVGTADRVLRHYIHGQLLVMLGVGIMYTAGYMIAGISLAVVLGILAGIVFVIPFASFVLSGIPALILAAVQFPGIVHPLMVALTIAATELVGNAVLTPVLVGRYVHVHPAAVLLFIFAGGALFGVLGMVMALPLAAISAAWIAQLTNDGA
jgi:predicted PurR-regulated permease PerM